MTSFNEVCIDVTKTARKIPQSDYLVNGKYKIFDQGKDYIGGYTDDDTGIVEEYPYIVFGDHTRIIKFVNEPCFIGADGVKLLKVYNLKFLPKYVYYSLVANPIVSSGYSRHFKYLKEQSIRDCSINEQKRIITELENHEKAISIKKESLSSLDELVKSRFVEMFENKDFGECLFEDICDCLRNGANIKQSKTASGYPITRIETLSNDKFNLDRMGYADIFDLEKYRKYLLQTDDILISHINSTAYLGRAVRYKGESNTPIIHGMNLLCARIKPMYNATYIEHYLKSVRAKDYIRSITKQAVNQASISTTELKLMPISVPPIELQNEFAEFVKLIDKSKFIVQQQIKDLQELVDSKMDEYFR